MKRYKRYFENNTRNLLKEYYVLQVAVSKQRAKSFAEILTKYKLKWDDYNEDEYFDHIYFQFESKHRGIVLRAIEDFNKQFKDDIFIEKM